MADQKLIKELWESDQASTLTNRAAREIEKLEIELQKAVDERNTAWVQLEESGIVILDAVGSEESNTYNPESASN